MSGVLLVSHERAHPPRLMQFTVPVPHWHGTTTLSPLVRALPQRPSAYVDNHQRVDAPGLRLPPAPDSNTRPVDIRQQWTEIPLIPRAAGYCIGMYSGSEIAGRVLMAHDFRVGACRARRPPAQKYHSAVDTRQPEIVASGTFLCRLACPSPASNLVLHWGSLSIDIGPAHRAERSAPRGDRGDTYACVRRASSAGGAVGRGAAGASSAAWGDVHTAGTESMWVWMSGFGRSVAGAGPIAGDDGHLGAWVRNGVRYGDRAVHAHRGGRGKSLFKGTEVQ
ncbi:hypothetical protein B0H14DRAFT_3869793 [Mycena olivaceomarginata]|nr:hypothetical protein B0H14DRAFT_3869793 [Mycena olivaceomarginata]